MREAGHLPGVSDREVERSWHRPDNAPGPPRGIPRTTSVPTATKKVTHTCSAHALVKTVTAIQSVQSEGRSRSRSLVASPSPSLLEMARTVLGVQLTLLTLFAPDRCGDGLPPGRGRSWGGGQGGCQQHMPLRGPCCRSWSFICSDLS